MRCLIITLFLILSCITLSQAVELDSDSNGAIDVNKGGTNATTTTQAKLNLGLSNVDNTSDANKPISTVTQTALDAKASKTTVIRYWSDWPDTSPGNTLAVGTVVAYEGDIYKTTQEFVKTAGATPAGFTSYFTKTTGYTLPTASAETKGGIKVGSRLSINAEGVLSADVQTTDISGKEDSLGNPSVNGYVLSSTTSGVRSWVEMTGGGTGIAHATTDGNYYASKDGGWASLTGLYAPALGADDNYVTDAEKTKIAGIAEGAEVNVNADWNSSSGDSQILNKPTIVTTVGATGADTNIPSEQAVREALNLKANTENIAFLAGALTDLKIKTTAQPTNGEPLIDDTVTYGATDDNLRLWSIDKIGSELAGKAASDHTHTGVYEPYDTTILKDADIGSTVQAYDANMITWPSAISAIEVGYLDGLTESLSTSLSTKETVVVSGSSTLATAEIAANTCSLQTFTATGALASTDRAEVYLGGRLSTVAGYGVTTAGALRIDAYLTDGNINFDVCNPTGAPITPGALTIKWKVLR